jgi:large subunit ribosomal protein L17
MGRKNVHGKTGVRFKAGYTTSKNKSMLRNVVSELFVHGKVEVTQATAKQVVSLADRLVTYAKKGDLASRRLAAKYVRPILADQKTGKTALQKLFDEIAPRYVDRNGGYTRILKLDNRLGDNAPICIVELV